MLNSVSGPGNASNGVLPFTNDINLMMYLPPDGPTIGFEVLKKKCALLGITVNESPRKKPRRSRKLVSSKAPIRSSQPEPQQVEDTPAVEQSEAEDTPQPEPQEEEEGVGMDSFEIDVPPTPDDDPVILLPPPPRSPSPLPPPEPLVVKTSNFDETLVEEPLLFASPAPTAVELRPPPVPAAPPLLLPTPAKPVLSNCSALKKPQVLPALKKSVVVETPAVKRRPGKPVKNGGGRVVVVEDGVHRGMKAQDIRRLASGTSPGRNPYTFLPGSQNIFKNSAEDNFFDLVSSLESTIARPVGSPSKAGNIAGDGSSLGDLSSFSLSTETQTESVALVDESAATTTTDGPPDPPPSVLEAAKLHMAFLYRRSSRDVPELYETAQTFWVSRSSGFEPTFFYWDPMPLATESLVCPKSTCRQQLSRFGHAVAPRLVYFRPDDDAEADPAFWIIGARYRCNLCTTKGKGKAGKEYGSYVAWDTRILGQLADATRREFPAVETEAGRLVVKDDQRKLAPWSETCPMKSPELIALCERLGPDTSTTTTAGMEEATSPLFQGPSIASSLSGGKKTSGTAISKPRAKRKCSKCLETGCKGNSKIVLCRNACKGCKRVDCTRPHRGGRNVCVDAGFLEVDLTTPSPPPVLPTRPPKPAVALEITPPRPAALVRTNSGTDEEEERNVEALLDAI